MKRRIAEYVLLGLGAASVLFAVLNVVQDWVPREAAIFLPLSFLFAYLTLNVFLEYRRTGEKPVSSRVWCICGLAGTTICLAGFLLNLLRG